MFRTLVMSCWLAYLNVKLYKMRKFMFITAVLFCLCFYMSFDSSVVDVLQEEKV